jgi:tetratricopeptide (TPR) repeat protein
LPAPDAARGGTPSLASLALARRQWFTIQRDDAPPALLYLAVRAARRALLADPGDARAQALLGESYLRFMLNTRERAWAGQLSQLRQLRQAQASAALNRAVSLRPDLPEAHLNLATLYGQMGYLDLAVHHERASLKLSRAEGPPPGSDPERFWENQARAEEALSQRARTVEAQENDYAVEASDLPVLDRAMLAFRKGLAGKARDVLLGSDVAGFGRQGTALELTLLLHTGRPQNVQEWMAPEQQGALGTPSYHWLRTQALAASGNYSLAKEECRELAQPATASLPNLEATSLRPYLGRLIGQAILDELPGGVPQLLRQPFRRQEFRNRAEGVVRILQQQANATVLRGVLALEEGDVDEARAAFRAALTLWQGEPAAASGNGLDFGGRAVALGLLAWLE